MEHFEEARLVEHVWDGAALNDNELGHLHSCEMCRAQLVELRSLAYELEVAQASLVRAETAARYLALFDQARPDPSVPAMLARAAQWLQAQLTFDSRTQALAGGVRSGMGSSYRLLFATDVAEIDLMVESAQGQRRVMGEIVDSAGAELLPALVVLTSGDGLTLFETESDVCGRFLFQGITPGDFSLVITPSRSVTAELHTLEVKSLEIT